MATVCNFPVGGTASCNNLLQLLQTCEPLGKLGLVFYFKSVHRPEIDVKTGWGVNFSFGQDGGGGGGGELSKNSVCCGGRILKILPL